MKRIGMRVAALAACAFVVATGFAADEKSLSVKQCMQCQQKMSKAVGAAAAAGKWDDAAKSSKTWLKAAEDMGKNNPPKGEKESWKTLTEKYLTSVKTIDESVGKKDADGVKKALEPFSGNKNCGECHGPHKPKK